MSRRTYYLHTINGDVGRYRDGIISQCCVVNIPADGVASLDILRRQQANALGIIADKYGIDILEKFRATSRYGYIRVVVDE